MNYIQNLLGRCHNPALSRKISHVVQIWHDGEITSQKCGPKLNQDRMFCLIPAIGRNENVYRDKPTTRSNGQSHIQHRDEHFKTDDTTPLVSYPKNVMPEQANETDGFAYVTHPQAIILRAAMVADARGELDKALYRQVIERLNAIPEGSK